MNVVLSSLADQEVVPTLPPPPCDALRDVDALFEGQLVAIWVSVSTSTATLVFDLRQADVGEAGNTAVLIARGVQSVRWQGQPWLQSWLAWNVGASRPRWTDNLFTLEMTFDHVSQQGVRTECVVVGEQAEYYVGDVPGLPDAPPDFGSDTEDVIPQGMAGPDSNFVARYVSSIP